MRQFLTALFFLSLTFIVPSARAEDKPTGFSIIQKQHESSKGYKDFSAFGTMLLKNKDGSPDTKRTFQISQIEGDASRPARLLLKITFPPDLSGTGLLSLTQPEKDTTQHLYLPALKQSRQIVANSRGGRFLGSEFFYEDLIPYSWRSYNYRLIGETNLDQRSPCHVIEVSPNGSIQSQYGKIIYYIEKDRLITLKTDFYSRRGDLVKEAFFGDYRHLNGRFWRPHLITMKSAKTGRSTELHLSDVRLDAGLAPDSLNLQALERE